MWGVFFERRIMQTRFTGSLIELQGVSGFYFFKPIRIFYFLLTPPPRRTRTQDADEWNSPVNC